MPRRIEPRLPKFSNGQRIRLKSLSNSGGEDLDLIGKAGTVLKGTESGPRIYYDILMDHRNNTNDPRGAWFIWEEDMELYDSTAIV